ncbi:MAG: CHAT domain-containing protein, partial [Cyanobacteria bacterium J06650_10]
LGTEQGLSLLGNTVVNAGTISVPSGNITLTAVEGSQLVRLGQGDRLLSLEVSNRDLPQDFTPQSLSELLTGSGVDYADNLVPNADGTVSLVSTGRSVSAEMTIPESNGTAVVSGNISVEDEIGISEIGTSEASESETGGEINIFGQQVALLNAQLSASGSQGGGTLRLGGDAKGSASAPTARRTYIDGASVLSADAILAGDGGQIYIWSDEATYFYGSLSAQGGTAWGDGGFAEISGKLNLVYNGQVDLSAPQGRAGTLLFDPTSILIKKGDGSNTTGEDAVLPQILNTDDNQSVPFIIYEATLESLASGTNILLESAIDIVIERLDGGELTLMPGNSITFKTDANLNNTGSFFMEQTDTIRAAGGTVRIIGGNDNRASIIGNIDTSTTAPELVGHISISDSNRVSARRLDAGAGTITLTSNGIDLRGGESSVVADVVTLRPSDLDTDIYLGTGLSSVDSLDLSVSDIQALSGDIGRIEIGRGSETGRITILENAADGGSEGVVFNSPTKILSESITLVGPDLNNTWRLNTSPDGESTSTLDGYSNLFFQNVSRLEGGALDDTIIFEDDSASIESLIDGKAGDLFLIGDEINLLGTTRGTGNLFIRTASDNQAILLGGVGADSDYSGGADTLDLVEDELVNIADTFTGITIGSRSDGSIRVLSDQAYRRPLTLLSGNSIETIGSRLSTTNGSDLTLDAGKILAGALATDGGDISLTSAGDITVSSLEARNPDFDPSTPVSSSNRSGGTITAETEGYFRVTDYLTDAVDTIDSVASTDDDLVADDSIDDELAALADDESAAQPVLESISTNGESAITIRHGGNGDVPFRVGEASDNGVLGSISNGVDDIVTGSFVGPYTQGAIEIVTDVIQPPPQPLERPLEQTLEQSLDQPLEPSLVLPESLSERSIDSVRQPVFEDGSDRASINVLFSDQEAATSQEIFSQIESAAGAQFEQFLSLTQQERPKKIATLAQVQDTLAAAERTLAVDPALLYVYFVPSAESAESVESSSSAKNAQSNAFQQNGGSADDQLEVMLIPPNGQPVRQRIWGVTRAQVEAQSTELRYQVTNQFSRKSDYLPLAQQLYDWIIRPLSADLDSLGTDNLAFIMDDGLRTIPIAVLHDGEQFLVEDYSLALMPTFSLTDLSSTIASVDSSTTDGERDFSGRAENRTGQVLAMGASRFDSQPPLPAVEAELTMVADELWQGEAFLNEGFTLANLKQQIEQERYGMLHLATHAVFNSGDWDNSYIQLWNERVSLKTLGELDLQQSNIDLIILSACNTAMGDRNSEYGFAGFAVNAGSASALASLWPVSDEGTLGFMSQFYEQLSQSNIKSESLRQAQISLLKGDIQIVNGELVGVDDETIAVVSELAESGNWDFSHPFYWSAFTMIGNPW